MSEDGSVALGTHSGCFDEPGWLQVAANNQSDWKGVQPFRTMNGYALISKGEDGSILRLMTLDFDEQATEQTVLAESNSDFLLVHDINFDGLDDFIYGSGAYTQVLGSSVRFDSEHVGFLGVALGHHRQTLFNPYFANIDDDPLEELFFVAPDLDGIDAYTPVDTLDNRLHYFHRVQSPHFAPGPYSKIMSNGGDILDGSILVGDTGTNSYQQCMAPQLIGGFRGFGDFNADGIKDIVYKRGNTWLVRILTGDGTLGVEQEMDVSNYGVRYPAIYDYNKDGVSDIITTCGGRVYVSGSSVDSQGESDIEFSDAVYSGTSNSCLPTYRPSDESPFKGDVNNDGLIDFVGWSGASLASQGQPDLMSIVTDGLGNMVEFEYSTLVDTLPSGESFYTPAVNAPTFPFVPVNRARQAVASVSVSDGKGGFNTQSFQYYGGLVDALGRGFLGFERIEVIDSSSSTKATSLYSQRFPATGKLRESIVEDLEGNKRSHKWVQNTTRPADDSLAVTPASVMLSYPVVTMETYYGDTPSTLNQPIFTISTGLSIDGFLNVTRKTTRIGDGREQIGSLDNVVSNVEVLNSYIYDRSNWLIGFADKSTVTTSANNDTKVVITEYEPEPGTADVKVTHNLVGDSKALSTTIRRNNKGLITRIESSTKDSDGTTELTRIKVLSDFEDGMHASTITSDLSHVEGLSYSRQHGGVVEKRDINNLVSTISYDSFGRITGAEDALGNTTAINSFYCANAPGLISCPAQAIYGVVSTVTNTQAEGHQGAPVSVDYYDKLQRVIRHEVYRYNQDVIKVDTRYDDKGRAVQVSEPFTADEAEFWTVRSNYDLSGRARRVDLPDGGVATYTFDEPDLQSGLLKSTESLSVITPHGTEQHQKLTFKDYLGQLTRVEDAEEIPIDYTYDAVGNLKTTVVNNDSRTKITLGYDAANNKISIEDPDTGLVSFKYNGFEELRKQIWQPGTTNEKSITYQYDVLGRKVSRVDQGGSTPASYSWVWDSLKMGALTSVGGNGYSASYTYNDLVQVETQTEVITGIQPKSFVYSYDAFGRLDSTTYPSGLRVKNGYHAAGGVVNTHDTTQPSNPKLLWHAGFDSDDRGRPTTQVLGNGIVTVQSYTAATGRLSTITSGRLSSSQNINELVGDTQKLKYTFDTLGNLYARESTRTNAQGSAIEWLHESFGYDYLNRLRHVSYTDNLLVQSDEAFDYDALGNLTLKGEIGVLTYDQSNNAGLHGVTSASGNSYHYDAYGNLSQRSRVGKGTEYLAYDTFNKPTQIGNTHFAYGPNHQRYKQVKGSTVTYYFAGGAYEVEQKSGVTTQKSYVGGFMVQAKVGTTVTNTYFHKDHLGSVESMTDANGNYIGRSSFDAWGRRRQDTWAQGSPNIVDSITSRGYTGHEMLDDLDLIHMNGRVYDPVIGRFLTPDLFIQAPTNTQSYNRYSYVLNNPLSYTDPSGYVCGPPDDTGSIISEHLNNTTDYLGWTQSALRAQIATARSGFSAKTRALGIVANARKELGLGVDDPVTIVIANGRMFAYSPSGESGGGGLFAGMGMLGLAAIGSDVLSLMALVSSAQEEGSESRVNEVALGGGFGASMMFWVLGADVTAEAGIIIDFSDPLGARVYFKGTGAALLGGGLYLGGGGVFSGGGSTGSSTAGLSSNLAYTVVAQGGELLSVGASGDLNLNALTKGEVLMDVSRGNAGVGVGAMAGSGLRGVVQYNSSSLREIYDFFSEWPE